MSDEQFTQLRQILEHQTEKLDNHDRTFERLFKRMDDGFNEIKAELATKASADQLNSVLNLLDANIREHEKQEVERVAMNTQLNRHDTWTHQLAKKVGVTLKYE